MWYVCIVTCESLSKHAEIDCGDPGTPSNGRLSLSDGTNFGSIVTYSCSEGYRLEGAETRTCLSGRVWSGSRPVCVSIGCGNPGSISNGNVIFSSSFDRFSIAEFSCSSGYTLSGSQTRVCLANGLWSAAQPDCECKSFAFLCKYYSEFLLIHQKFI